ncbi:TRAP transporter small permease [Martelella sp. HB161492]|uniref:TRAP transporter small permease subunit n=1 Tax=Martelella sp. HB161492 TaxID=2720726 RepID=UPI00158FD038|nr:TRAP transporter small permease [Martelella sp. HB161492]
MRNRFLIFTDWTARIAETMAMILLYGFCALMLAEVISRAVVHTSLAVSWEYSAFAMAAVILLGLGPSLRHGKQVRVSLLLARGGPGFRIGVEIFATLVGIALALLMLNAFWSVFYTSLVRGVRQSSYVNTPLAIPQFFAVIGALEFVLALVARLVRLVSGLEPDLIEKEEDALD